MQQLKRLRMEKGLSQAKLAALADVDPSTVNQIERGVREASPATLRKLAEALEVSIAQLLEDAAPKAERRSSREPRLFNGLEEERRTKLAELESFVRYAIGRAQFWEQELERGRATDYRTAESVYKLSVLALQEFMSIAVWLFNEGPARPLYQAIEQGVGLEIEEAYDALTNQLIERTALTQRNLFAYAERLAETEAERNEIAAKRREAEAALNANVRERSA